LLDKGALFTCSVKLIVFVMIVSKRCIELNQSVDQETHEQTNACTNPSDELIKTLVVVVVV